MCGKIIKNSSIVAAYSQIQTAIWLILIQCRGKTMTDHCTKFRLQTIRRTLAINEFVRASLIEAAKIFA